MVALYIILSLLILFIFLELVPALIAFFKIFSRKKIVFLEEYRFKDTYLAPFEKPIKDNAARLRLNESRPVKMSSFDGKVMSGLYFDKNSDKTAVFFHGFCSDPFMNFSAQANDLIENGFNILFVYQRAHSGSEGRYAGLGMIERNDVTAWSEYAVRELGAKEILIYGMSAGCAAVSYASCDLNPDYVKAIVPDCGFSSPWDQMERNCRIRNIPPVIILPMVRLITKIVIGKDIKKSVMESLAKNRVPALFIHGEGDSTIPPAQGEQNYNSCSSEKEKLFVKDAEHALAYIAGGEETKKAFIQFVNKYFKE